MQIIRNILFLGLVACGGAPLTQTSAVSEDQLRLELVANDSNSYSYQLRLCRGNSADACRVALLDAQGQAAKLYPFELQRSSFATYKGYAVVALALVAAPLVGATMWRKWIRKADAVLEAGQGAMRQRKYSYKQQAKQLQEEITEQLDEADEELDAALQEIRKETRSERRIKYNEIADNVNDMLDKKALLYTYNTTLADYYPKLMEKDMAAAIDEIVAEMQSSLTRQINSKADNLADLEIASKAEKSKIRKNIKGLASKIEELDSSIADKLDAGTLHVDINEQDLAKLDSIFAERLAQRKSSFQLGDDGIEFYQGYAKTQQLNNADTLRFLERKRQLLEMVKEGHTLNIKKLKAELHELNEPVTRFFREYEMLDDYYDAFPEDKFLFEQLTSLDEEEYVPSLLLKADAIQAKGGGLYRTAMAHLLEIRVKEESIELAEKIKNSSIDLDAALTQVDADIATAREVFFADIDADMLAKIKDISDDYSFRKRVLALALDSPPPSQTIATKRNKIAEMKNSLVINKEDIEEASTEIASWQKELEALPQKTAELKKHITEWEEKFAQVQTKAAEQKKQAEDLHTHSLADIEQRRLAQQKHESENRHKLAGEGEELAKQQRGTKAKAKRTSIAAGAGLLGAVAAFDHVVWGNKERQRSRHWQMLSDKHAITVTDVAEAKKILHSIATISDYNINPRVLVLLD